MKVTVVPIGLGRGLYFETREDLEAFVNSPNVVTVPAPNKPGYRETMNGLPLRVGKPIHAIAVQHPYMRQATRVP